MCPHASHDTSIGRWPCCRVARSSWGLIREPRHWQPIAEWGEAVCILRHADHHHARALPFVRRQSVRAVLLSPRSFSKSETAAGAASSAVDPVILTLLPDTRTLDPLADHPGQRSTYI